MRHRLLRVVAAMAVLVSGLLAVGPARAQVSGPGVGIRAVDATDPSAVEVTFFYTGERDDLSGLALREDDRLVETTPAVPLSDQQALGVVLVIDASGSMEAGALIEKVKAAAHDFVDAKSATDQMAVVSFNREVRLEQGFTRDKAVLDEAIDRIALDDDTSLFDGIVRGASLFEESDLQPNVIVFSDGGDTTSTADRARAEAVLKNTGSVLFAVGVDNPQFDTLRDMAARSGGSAAVASNPEGVGDLFSAVQSTLQKQYVVTYESRATEGPVSLDLTVADQQDSAEFVAGSEQQGAASLEAQTVEKPSGPAFFRTSAGLALALVLVAAAAAVAIFSVGSTFLGNEGGLRQALRPYAEGYVASPEASADGDDKGGAMAQTQLLQRAVAATGQFAERQGLLSKVESMLERANLPLRPAEGLFFYVAGVAVVALLFLGLAGSPLAALIGVAVVAIIPPTVLVFLANRRRKQFEALLPDTLQLLASTLRAGYSLMQGVEAVSQEVSEPMGRELRRVVTEARLGRPLEDSLDGVAARMGSGDFAWAVMAIGIQREVGGNLAELLVTVAETMTERERLRRDVNALTAEGKISAIVLAVLPVGLGFFIYTINPGYMDPLFEDTVGQFLLGGSVLLALFGFWWMKKTIEIDI